MNIWNKIILVTGAGSGIGKALTLALLDGGARVAAVDLREESLQELVKDLGDHSTSSGSSNRADRVSIHAANISDRKAVEALPKDIIAKMGEIDGIINCAGIIQPFVRINDLDYETIERVMNVNFFGTLYMTKTFLPHLLKRPEAHIVNVSSMGGFLPVPGQAVYGASKAAVKLMTEGLYAEMSGTNVHVSVVFPGATATNITANSGIKMPESGKTTAEQPKFKMLPASEAARLIVKGMEKNKFQIFLGSDSNMMNLLYRLNPRYATNLIAKQMKSLLPK